MRKLKFIAIMALLHLGYNADGQSLIEASPIALPSTAGGSYVEASGQLQAIVSGTSVNLGNDFSALSGSNLSVSVSSTVMYPQPQPNGLENMEMNWTSQSAFDENGNTIAQSKSFFDFTGQVLQTQTKSFSTQHVLASQTINDLYGRPAIQTLAAPINSSGFVYRSDFVKSATGTAYNTTNFDQGNKLNSPDGLSATGVGSLGWYYSNNNTWDKTVPATAFPYSRNDYFNDGTSAPARSAGVGEELRMGKNRETISNTFPVVNELSYYLQLRNSIFTNNNTGQTGQANLNGSVLQTVSKDAQGSWAMTVQDKDGKTLMSAIPGNLLTVNNTVTLNNYKEEYNLNFGTLNLNLTQIKLIGAGKLNVYKNGVLSSFNTVSEYFAEDVTVSNPTYRFLSDQPFTLSYSKLVPIVNSFTINEQPVCENCHSQVQVGSVSGQDYHYLSLPTNGNLNITGGTVKVIDLVSNLFTTQNTTVSLPSGMYKIQAMIGTPQITYSTSWENINFNYYDLQGQLIATIPPNGVAQLRGLTSAPSTNRNDIPFVTLFEYDRQGRLIAVDNKSETGRSEFIYRKDGNIRFSQNAEQRKTGKFSYTKYDEIARPTESGEYLPTVGDITFEAVKTNYPFIENTSSNDGLSLGTKSDWVRTYYDTPTNMFVQQGYVQDYTDGAVTWTEGPNSKTWYGYNEQGKVIWIIKWINGLGFKSIDYAYDYLGNVTIVAYQKNGSDKFYHGYTYDADQRLVNVQTSLDGINRTQQANYQYYLHGPLKRLELGNKVQGIDYVYTAQGLLKSINQIFGNDVDNDATNGFAPDAFSMQLDYFRNDYNRTGIDIGSINTLQPSYYNGNITGFSWRSSKPASVVSIMGPSIEAASMYTYIYDKKYQLNSAICGSPGFTGRAFSAATRFAERGMTYDANGNLRGMQRTNNVGQLSDDFSSYRYQANTNKLISVGNAANPAAYATYSYDDLGQLKTQTKTGAPFSYNMKYDVTGKITGIYADAALTQLRLAYFYDESGNRIARVDYTGSTPQITYTVYDASGTPLAIYNNTTISEVPIYGSERLGTYSPTFNVYAYELRDNVGSVRVVIGNTKTATGQANVYSYNDYYPYGSIARSGGVTYRYEYQGAYAEKDPLTGFNNFDLRMYDGRIGRWLSTDPNAQYYSPYVGMGNNPVSMVDPDGGWDEDGAAAKNAANGGGGVTQSGSEFGYTTTGENGPIFHFEKVQTSQGWNASSFLNDTWNSWNVRSIVPDMISVNVGASFVFAGGAAGSYAAHLVTRGPDAGLYTTFTTSKRLGMLLDLSGGASVGWYLGKVHNIKISDFLGSGLEAGGKFLYGFSVSESHNNVGTPTWITGSYSSGLSAGGYVGASNTYPVLGFRK